MITASSYLAPRGKRRGPPGTPLRGDDGPSTQYAIYTFRDRQEPRGDQGDWERIRACACAQEALQQASDLYKTRQYARVEVKKMFFNLKTRRAAASTLKIFGAGSGFYRIKIALVLVLAFALGGVAAHEGLSLFAAFLQP